MGLGATVRTSVASLCASRPESLSVCLCGPPQVNAVLMQDTFKEDPHAAAKKVWQETFERTGQYPLANGVPVL